MDWGALGRNQASDVGTSGHLPPGLIFAIPGRLVLAGLPVLLHQVRKLPP